MLQFQQGDGGLNQALLEVAALIASNQPEFFQHVMSFEIRLAVEALDELSQMRIARHYCGLVVTTELKLP